MLQGLYLLASNLDASPASDFAGSNQIGGQSPRGDVRRPGGWGWWWLTILPNSPIKGISMKGRGSGKLPAWLGPPFPVTNHSEKQSKLHLNWDIPNIYSVLFFVGAALRKTSVLWAPPPRLTQRRWKHDTRLTYQGTKVVVVGLLLSISWYFWHQLHGISPTLWWFGPKTQENYLTDTYTNVKVHQSQDDHSTPSTAQIHGENLYLKIGVPEARPASQEVIA